MLPSKGEESENALPEEQRFYYLRLMAKPGGKKEPIKTKFVRWARPSQDDPVESAVDLESQAMRVVRTIGQAFEVCHKVAQEQIQEKIQEEIEGNNNRRSKDSYEESSDEYDMAQSMITPGLYGCRRDLSHHSYGNRKKVMRKTRKKQRARTNGSIISEESEQHEIEEKLSKVDEASGSASPADEQPSQPSTFLQRRHSIFQVQPAMAVQEAQTTSSGLNRDASKDVKDKDNIASNPSTEPQKTSSQSHPSNLSNPFGLGRSNPPQLATTTSSSATLPTQSHMWTPQMPSGNFQSMQSLDQRAFPSTFPFYPVQMMTPSASMPFGMGSPLMVSPYATLQLRGNNPSTSQNIPDNSPENRDLAAVQLSMSLDQVLQYNQHLIRSQLDQAQQTAQVASCQVQLLRDQLTSETTARIEAQSRTHQLLNANRELLEQVQALVSRLQILESKLSSDIHLQANQPSTSKSAFAPLEMPSNKDQSEMSCKSVPKSAANPYHEAECEARVPGPPPIDPSKPYQLQSLADIRAGSLPPSAPNEKVGNTYANKKRRPADDVGVRTEPESGTEDTTDYSSSDQYEKSSNLKALNQKMALEFPQLNIFMSNPQAMPNVSSFFSAQQSYQPFIQSSLPFNRNDRRDMTCVKPIEEEDQQPGTSENSKRPKDKFGGVFDERKFNRMSFNAKLMKRTSPEFLPRSEDSEAIFGEETILKDRTTERRCTDEEEVMRKRPERSRRIIEAATIDESFLPNRSSEIIGDDMKSRLVRLKSPPSTPASSSLVTAMYPPKSSPSRELSRPSLALQKKSLRALSVDVDHEPLNSMGNGPISALTNHVGVESKQFAQMRIGNHEELGEMIALQEALKYGLAGTRQQMQKNKDDLDGMRSTAQLIDHSRSKLSDPALLAKLTRIPIYKNTVEGNERSKGDPERSAP